MISTLTVVNASYGRFPGDSQSCSYTTRNCTLVDALAYYANICNGKETCTVGIPPTTAFPDPCGGVPKYAFIRFYCAATATCEAGWEIVPPASFCTNCPVGTYTNSSGQRCMRCPVVNGYNTTTPNPGSYSASFCTGACGPTCARAHLSTGRRACGAASERRRMEQLLGARTALSY